MAIYSEFGFHNEVLMASVLVTITLFLGGTIPLVGDYFSLRQTGLAESQMGTMREPKSSFAKR